MVDTLAYSAHMRDEYGYRNEYGDCRSPTQLEKQNTI